MADKVTAKNSDVKFTPHPEGQHPGQCVDCVDLGEKVEDFAGTPKKLAPKCALVFRTGEKNAETGAFIDIAREFTVSMGDLANLRKFLESWRGKTYGANEIDAGVPLDKLVGNWALLNIEHKTSGKGRKYANIIGVMGVPKEMKASLGNFPAYERPDYWAERKKEYGDAARKFRAEIGAPSAGVHEDDIGESGEDFADDGDEGMDLPFSPASTTTAPVEAAQKRIYPNDLLPLRPV